jgi:hypothetical protein
VVTQARLPLAISSPTHPVISNDFEVDIDQFGPRESGLGCQVGLVDTEPTQGRYCLAAVNAYPAADFALNLRSTIFDAAKLPKLSFDYRFPKGAPINLYLETGGRKTYTILMTGKESKECPTIGTIAGAAADGAWHRAEIDLAQCLAGQLKDVPYQVKSIWLADRSASPELHWYGFGEIPGGSWLYLDNFALRGPGEREVAFEWSAVQDRLAALPAAKTDSGTTRTGRGLRAEPLVIADELVLVDNPGDALVVEGGLVAEDVVLVRDEAKVRRALAAAHAAEIAIPAEIADIESVVAEPVNGPVAAPPPPPPPKVEIVGYGYVFDRKPDTEAPKESKGSATSAKFTADGAGLWYLHLRAKAKDGTWGDTFHCGVLVK